MDTMDTRTRTVLNNVLRPNPCFRQITGLRSLVTENGQDLFIIVQQLINKINILENKIQNFNLTNLNDVNTEGVEDNAQLGYDSVSKTWVPFNAESTEPVDEPSEPVINEDEEDTAIDNSKSP